MSKEQALEELLKMIKETNSVSIHIRRTDKKLTGYLSLNYYKDDKRGKYYRLRCRISFIPG